MRKESFLKFAMKRSPITALAAFLCSAVAHPVMAQYNFWGNNPKGGAKPPYTWTAVQLPIPPYAPAFDHEPWVGIGIQTPFDKLHVNADATLTNETTQYPVLRVSRGYANTSNPTPRFYGPFGQFGIASNMLTQPNMPNNYLSSVTPRQDPASPGYDPNTPGFYSPGDLVLSAGPSLPIPMQTYQGPQDLILTNRDGGNIIFATSPVGGALDYTAAQDRERMLITPFGQVGIGLPAGGTIYGGGLLQLGDRTKFWDGASFNLAHNIYWDNNAGVSRRMKQGGGGSLAFTHDIGMTLSVFEDGSANSQVDFDANKLLHMNPSGNIAIGAWSSYNHKLYVNGNIALGQDGTNNRKVIWGIEPYNSSDPNTDKHWMGYEGINDWWMKFTAHANEGFIFRNKEDETMMKIAGRWAPGGQHVYIQDRLFIGVDPETNTISSTNLIAPLKLAVNGGVKAKEYVAEVDGWADFVFTGNYQLPSLDEVEQHIKDKKHLPDIPSEKEVMANGVNIGQMQAKLLQKIEEMTLYIIEQDKRLKVLEEENKRLNNK